jgi:hypothetical protein
MPLPFPLSQHFGTLADGLGCSPLDHEAYPSQSHSRAPRHGIRSLVGFGRTPVPLAHPVLYHRDASSEAAPQCISGRTSYLRVRLAFHPYPQLIRWFCNTNRCGPPRGVNLASPWPWVDHPVSGLLRATRRPVQTRFPYASGVHPLKLATRSNSPAHSSIGTPSGIPEPCGSGIALRLIVGTRFQVLFHSPPGVLFTFPSRYSCAIGRQEYLALEGGPPEFPRGSTCPAVLRNAAQEASPFSPTGLSPSLACRSRAVRLTARFVTSRPVLRPVRRRPVTPSVQRRRALTHRRFRLFPVRSPLLGESRLISFPQGTEMFQFPCLPSRAYGFSAG